MSRKTFVQGALIVLSASIITRILGFVFRIYISNQLGAEGMGLYQLVTSLYMLVVTFATSGITIAVSRMVAEQLEANLYGSKTTILRMSVIYSMAISIIVAVLLFSFSQPLGMYILEDERTILSLKYLAPSIPFMAVSACIKGYYYALRKSFTPSSAQVIEQIVKMGFIVAIMGFMMPKGYEYACGAAVLGMTVGEVASCIYVVCMYMAGKKKEQQKISKRRKTFGTILHISLPIQFSSTFHSLLRLVENLLIIAGLKTFAGGDNSLAISSYGILKGMVLPLLSFPTSLLGALVVSLIPEVAGANAGGKDGTVARAVRKVLQMTLLMSVVIVAIFMIFPNEIGNLVYNEAQVGQMLQMLCFICPLMYLEMVTVGILNAIGEQVKPMQYNILDSLLRIALIYLFVPHWGIWGFMWIMIASNLFTSIMNLRRLLKVTGVKPEVSNWIIKPAIAAAASGLIVKLICNYFMTQGFSTLIVILLGMAIIVVLYFILLFALGSVKKSDVEWLADSFRKKKISGKKS